MSERISAVFLDRDGTINIDSGYITSPSELFLIPGAGKAIGDLKRAGLAVVIVSNQSAVGRGLTTEEKVDQTNEQLRALLLAEDGGAAIDLILYCPHHPDEQCSCRKPLTGMVDQSPIAGKFSPESSWMVGDKLSDIDFGLALKIAPEHLILVQTGDGAQALTSANTSGRIVRSASGLREAAQLILSECEGLR